MMNVERLRIHKHGTRMAAYGWKHKDPLVTDKRVHVFASSEQKFSPDTWLAEMQ